MPKLSLTALTESDFRNAVAELSNRDPGLENIVARWGQPPFWTQQPGFAGLILTILSQQVSLSSANAAYAKLAERITPVDPSQFLTLDDQTLKEIGFSRQKAGYVRGIASAIKNGEVDLEMIAQMDDDLAHRALLVIKGIGPWTADSYLLFALRRPDAWPTGDLALAKAIQSMRGFETIPSYDETDRIAMFWRPWRAVAARMLWHGYLSERGRN